MSTTRAAGWPEGVHTLSVSQAADALGISRNVAYDAIRRGEIPSLRLGRKIRVPVAKLRAMLGEIDDDNGGAA